METENEDVTDTVPFITQENDDDLIEDTGYVDN